MRSAARTSLAIISDRQTEQTRSLRSIINGVTASNPQSITSQLFPTIDNPPITVANPSSFGEDANGEPYITDLGNSGSVYKIVAGDAEGSD
jgi:hypothetical protein